MLSVRRVTLIGAGNVATHLGNALNNAGINVEQVYSKTIQKANKLAGQLNSNATDDLTQIHTNTDVIFLLVKDTMMMEVLGRFNTGNAILVHASGSVEMEVLKPYAAKYGVFYPLQTFSSERKLQFDNIPLCIEASNEENTESLLGLARQLSKDVRQLNSKQRLIVHIAAVFACNFTNYMYAIAEELLKKYELPYDILHPLIMETSEKGSMMSPALVQTGPAFRNDQEIIKKHMDLLKDDQKISVIYNIISELIMKRHTLFDKSGNKS